MVLCLMHLFITKLETKSAFDASILITGAGAVDSGACNNAGNKYLGIESARGGSVFRARNVDYPLRCAVFGTRIEYL